MGLSRTFRSVARNFGYDLVKMKHAAGSGIMEAFPPGHFYSVVPSTKELSERSDEIFSPSIHVAGIELNLDKQLRYLEKFKDLSEVPPFYSEERTRRFQIENDSFSFDDAPVLHYMLRTIRPKRVIEIGSGCSSACMLDTSETYLDESIDFTFIDVDCKNLRKNLRASDHEKINVLEQPIQEVDPSIFTKLQANDFLFVDSSHVMKAGSDLHTILFDILPVLASGVYVHFHDVRYPFQYEKKMIMRGILWNEAYMLRSFLMYNSAFEITFWLNCLANLKPDEIRASLDFLPLAEWDRRFNGSSQNYSSAGGSIYIRKK